MQTGPSNNFFISIFLIKEFLIFLKTKSKISKYRLKAFVSWEIDK